MELKPLCIALVTSIACAGLQNLYSQIVIESKGDSRFELRVNGVKTFIKGAVAYEYIDKIKKYGGNSIRVRCSKERLEKAWQSGLMAMVDLPFKAERNGFDYNNKEAVSKQQEEVLALVKQYKDHPSIMFWAIGNELDFVPGNKPFNPLVWDAVNSTAMAIKAIDPNHPVLTVIGTSRMYKLADIVQRCPALDLLGLNTYQDIYGVRDTINKYGWKKPYVIAEWGPSGYWEVKKTPWKAPFEETSAEKAVAYRNKYEQAIVANEGHCLGSFVFYWSGHKQETTHTWFNMFDAEGLETPVVDVMQYSWTGKWPKNLSPVVDSLNIDGKQRYFAHKLKPSTMYAAQAFARDGDEDALNYKWEIRQEAQYAAYAGQGEQEPKPISGLADGTGAEIKFTTPAGKGAYRLFVYVYDKHDHSASANIPFYVDKE